MSRMKNGLVFLVITLAVCGIASMFGVVASQDWVQRADASGVGKVVLGMPVDWELNFPYAGTPFGRDLFRFHNLLFSVDLAICSLVAILLFYSVWRFRKSRNAVPSDRTHNTPLELLWTVLPGLVLVGIAVPSFSLVYRYNVIPASGMTLKVTGHQWYWEYQYPTNGNLDITSTILPDAKLKAQQGHNSVRLLAVDNYAVLPVGTVIRIEVTGADVIHSFMVPSLGLQKYAIPGRINEIWTRIDREGDYYGQCSQLCGQNHAFMPIGIRAVSRKAFDDWVKKQKEQNVSLLGVHGAAPAGGNARVE
ncbi:cytochrome c oxidase subunit II [Bradyrhizobium sp. ISRA443]|uniref:cytochrome c oxidase subunit II n=1 Tax=unclassified Bradyrhizobium TaxID=2631580 RepID=UPI002478FAE6|nr:MULTISPECIES: cytochrome c oxidase subunit II [unclassified Bradyrhizobium]WGR94932.1 cytochrome c oxidase subunit II [Bradyrhizobium sp. ISRA435]WGR99794.1 cytochrome c oxidase subunit II [Bradyrhizobium sp. ISRA436]WGS06684.1 cytochrome c oxidase subunit II [Bradyrhizobium sp. ISRA437]WGS13568.1 cytochrome c oxidase subunit II [Bradyrhizobium sp. ISRA443]